MVLFVKGFEFEFPVSCGDIVILLCSLSPYFEDLCAEQSLFLSTDLAASFYITLFRSLLLFLDLVILGDRSNVFICFTDDLLADLCRDLNFC